MKAKLLSVLIAAAFVFVTFDQAFADAPVYAVELYNPGYNITGHKRVGDSYPRVNAEWTERIRYRGLTVTLEFKYLSLSETVVTPAGTFDNCAKLRIRITAWPFIDETAYIFSAENVGRILVTSTASEDFALTEYNIVGGEGYDPVAIGNWWEFDNDKRYGVIAYEQHRNYDCYYEVGFDEEIVAWLDVTGVPGPGLTPIYVNMMPYVTDVTGNRGDYFEFIATVGNSSNQSQVADVWIMLDVPGIGLYGPVRRFDDIPLSAMDAIVATHVRQYIPYIAPLGTYRYIAYGGTYPGAIVDSSWFPFTIAGAGVGPGRAGRAEEWTLSGWLDREDFSPAVPCETGLLANYPNPFNACTSIRFELPAAGDVRLDVYNLIGQHVATLVDGYKAAGEHTVNWNASDMSSGIYFYRLTAGDYCRTRSMTLVK